MGRDCSCCMNISRTRRGCALGSVLYAGNATFVLERPILIRIAGPPLAILVLYACPDASGADAADRLGLTVMH